MLATLSARDPGMLRRLGAVVCWGSLLLLAPLPSGAGDVCRLTGTEKPAELEKAAAEIAEAYARTPASGKFSLGSGPTSASTPACMTHACRFVQYNCSRTGSQMGLSITDADYRKKTDAIFRGALMQVPSWLVRASQSGKVKELTDAVEATSGASWMKFSSTSVANVAADGSLDGAGRVIIRVLDTQKPPRFEQWIQIAINERTGNLGRNVDFIAVQLRSDATPSEELMPPVVTFRGYSRTSGGFVPEGAGSGSSLTKCYSCHPNGLRTIVPAHPVGARAKTGVTIVPEGTIPFAGPGSITALTNDDNKKRALLEPGYAALENGPPLGPSTRPNRKEFVAKGCAAGVSPLRRPAIVANMDCERCHDGTTDRGILNAGTSLDTLHHKVVENTVAPMPPPVVWDQDPSLKLSPAEREALFKCLQAEYAEILQEWLTSSP